MRKIGMTVNSGIWSGEMQIRQAIKKFAEKVEKNITSINKSFSKHIRGRKRLTAVPVRSTNVKVWKKHEQRNESSASVVTSNLRSCPLCNSFCRGLIKQGRKVKHRKGHATVVSSNKTLAPDSIYPRVLKKLNEERS